MDAIARELSQVARINSVGSDSTTAPSSNLSSYFTTSSSNTQATTPGGISSGGFHTIIVTSKDLGSLKAIERAFIEFEPFKSFACAFCSKTEFTCKCQAFETISTAIPSTKKRLLKYLDQEQIEAGHIQAATLAYLLVLEKHVPFGPEFNIDQQIKCGIMHRQLEEVKNRISDIKKALGLLDNDKSAVPDGILGACNHFRPVLAVCLGNARENHICFKLNFKLFTK